MSWQQAMQNGFTNARELLKFLDLDEGHYSDGAACDFKMKVPLGFAKKMRKGDINCPLLRQVLPLESELQKAEGFVLDPLQEKASNPIKGLLHKYHGRVLVTLTGRCAINCRYCFRRHFPYHENQLARKDWADIVRYLTKDKSLYEVILSGGDPLLLPNALFQQFLECLLPLTHIKTLRVHSRLPVVLPERIDNGFTQLLKAFPRQKVVVLHINHEREICSELSKAVLFLKEAGALVLNQSVLLKDVNDTVERLTSLSHALLQVGILPYYLHVLDKVVGAHHFRVSDEKAKSLHKLMLERLPGYLVPRLTREVPGLAHKQWLNCV